MNLKTTFEAAMVVICLGCSAYLVNSYIDKRNTISVYSFQADIQDMKTYAFNSK